MTPAPKTERHLPATPSGYLPPRIRALFIHGSRRTGGWLAEAFASDNASEVSLEDVEGMSAGVASLRDEVFDAVLISHEPDELNALDLLDAVHTGSGDGQSIVVLGAASEREMAALCYEAGADAYVCLRTATTRALIWTVARAIEHQRLIAENRRLEQTEQHRLQLEHDEASRLLGQQHGIIADLEQLRGDSSVEQPMPPAGEQEHAVAPALFDHYRELLRTYVVMGSGNLSAEIQQFSTTLAAAGQTPQDVLLLHLEIVEEMIHGLGNRSSRHVMARADMLILEVMVNLAEQYRRSYVDAVHPPRQLELPGLNGTSREIA